MMAWPRSGYEPTTVASTETATSSQRARAERGLEGVEEDVVAGTHFVGVGECDRRRERRRRADAARDARVHRSSSARKRVSDADLLGGDAADLVDVARVVRMAGVRQQSLKVHRRRLRRSPAPAARCRDRRDRRRRGDSRNRLSERRRKRRRSRRETPLPPVERARCR